MSNLTYRLLSGLLTLLALWVAIRGVIGWARSEGFGAEVWHWPTAASCLMAVPIMVLIVSEFVTGRAFGWGLTVVRRHESPKAYWFWIAMHVAAVLVVAVAAWVNLPD